MYGSTLLYQLKLRLELFKGDRHNYRLIADFSLFLKLKNKTAKRIHCLIARNIGGIVHSRE